MPPFKLNIKSSSYREANISCWASTFAYSTHQLKKTLKKAQRWKCDKCCCCWRWGHLFISKTFVNFWWSLCLSLQLDSAPKLMSHIVCPLPIKQQLLTQEEKVWRKVRGLPGLARPVRHHQFISTVLSGLNCPLFVIKQVLTL